MTSPKDLSPPKTSQEDPKSDKKDLPTKETFSSTEMAKEIPSDGEGGQLFFSTDGEESPVPKENPYEEESKEPQKPSASPPPGDNHEGSPRKGEQHPPRKNTGVHPKQYQQPNKGNKRQNWQDKKRPQNRQRQKFKKPKKLPFEETEVRPLEIGDLLENENFKSEAGLLALAEEFAASTDKSISLDELLPLSLLELKEKVTALPLELSLPAAPLREEVIDSLLDCCLEKKVPVQVTGIIQVMEDGHGFLLQEKENYRLKSQSPFVPAPLIKKYGIKTGQCVQGFVRSKIDGATCPLLLQVEKIMDGDPEKASRVTPFTELVPYYPLERIFLETDEKAEWDNVSMRVVDLVSPIGFGQRGLIVAPPRTGKTVLQQGIARALRVNNPKAHLIVLLVDERPEEVTDFRRQVPDAEVIASTFDESAESHVHAAEIVIEKARRMVEHEQDVVILLDSITRLARAYNATMPNSGKILSGGVEATALQRPKRFFGSARNIEGGGSLTILGTALVETGSKMDEVIFEEFKGTGNMELHLDRELSNKRIFPALDFEKSGTRKEELLYHAEELTKIYSLRRSLKGVPPAEAMEMFIQRVRKTKNNPEFLVGLGR
ncbi:MAG: transcription termination factor Rho [Verrucomicrobiota bacterium]|nr:transcription termination factor Rho [Verrucomicrobiota bacterium]